MPITAKRHQAMCQLAHGHGHRTGLLVGARRPPQRRQRRGIVAVAVKPSSSTPKALAAAAQRLLKAVESQPFQTPPRPMAEDFRWNSGFCGFLVWCMILLQLHELASEQGASTRSEDSSSRSLHRSLCLCMFWFFTTLRLLKMSAAKLPCPKNEMISSTLRKSMSLQLFHSATWGVGPRSPRSTSQDEKVTSQHLSEVSQSCCSKGTWGEAVDHQPREIPDI